MVRLLRDDRVLRMLTKARRPMSVNQVAKRLRFRQKMSQDRRLQAAERSCRRLVRDGLAWETADGRFTTDSHQAANERRRKQETA